MAIETEQDAKKYLKVIQSELIQLANLSKEAGLNKHTALWFGLAGAFMHSTEAVDRVINAIMTQVELDQLISDAGYLKQDITI